MSPRMRAAVAAYRAATPAMRATDGMAGDGPERRAAVKAWADAQWELQQAALADEAPLTITKTREVTWTLGPWEPGDFGSGREWMVAGDDDRGDECQAAQVLDRGERNAEKDNGRRWQWTIYEPWTDGEVGVGFAPTEPEARDAADEALEQLCAPRPSPLASEEGGR